MLSLVLVASTVAYHIRQLSTEGVGNIWETRMEKTT